MKTKQFIPIIILLLLSLSSCREISVSTKVNEDGSFTRIITVTGDSSDVFNPDLPYPVDDTWVQSARKDTSSDGDYILTYTKTFKDSKQLNDEIGRDTGWRKQVNREIKVRKGFGFFYSYLTYRETWEAANPFSQLDYKDYLSEEDIHWLSGYQVVTNENDSMRMIEAEDKAEQFLYEAISAEIIIALENGARSLKSEELSGYDFRLYKDSIMQKMNEWDFKSARDFIDYYVEWTGDDRVLVLHEIESSVFDEIDRDILLLENVFGMEGHQVFVEMPGLITSTNSPSINGNQVSWKMSGMSFLFQDYEMSAQTRTVNKWAFVLAGIVLLLLVVVLVLKTRK